MDQYIAIVFMLLLAVGVGWWVSRPLMKKETPESNPVPDVGKEHSTLLAERERILKVLQELEFDHTLGKVPEEDYHQQHAEWITKGAVNLKALDEWKTAHPQPVSEQDTNVVIEKLEDQRMEAMVMARRKQRVEKSAGFCSHCGQPYQKSDRFCATCGARLESAK
jgi:NADH pyrophosphatase NudC (nudix superfamily)